MSLPYGTAIAIKLATTSVSSLGIVIQRKSHVINDEKPIEERKNALKRPLWHLGFWLYIICAGAGTVSSISSLPILVIAPLSTFTLLFNAIYAHFLLNEKMTWIGIMGNVLIAAASAGMAIVLDLPQIPLHARELVLFLKRTRYLIYITITTILLLCFIFYGWKLSVEHKKEAGNVTFNSTRRRALKIAISFELAATILASQAIIFAKISYDLLMLSLQTGENQFSDPISPVILTITIVSTIFELLFFNVSLHYYTTVVIIPIGYSAGIALACLNTFFYYESFSELSAWKSVLVVFSVVVIICGIYLLSKKKSTKIPVVENNVDDDEEHVHLRGEIPVNQL